MTITVGEPDPFGDEVRRIFRRSDAYVIYETRYGVRWRLAPELQEPFELRRRLHEIGGGLAAAQALAATALRRADGELARIDIAAAIAQAFDGDDRGANARLATLEHRLRAGRSGAAKLRYASAAFVATLAAALIAALVQWPSAGGALDLREAYGLHALMGTIGAFLSILTGLPKLEFEAEASEIEIYAAPLPRLAIGAVAAIATALAMDAGFIALTPDAEIDASAFAYALWCLVAGFSETLVPNLLARVERAVEPARAVEARG